MEDKNDPVEDKGQDGSGVAGKDQEDDSGKDYCWYCGTEYYV